MLRITTSTGEKRDIPSIVMAVILLVSVMGVFFTMLQVSIVPSVLRFASPVESFRVLLNQLFIISEQNQAYVYEHFVVGVAAQYWAGYIYFALIISAVVMAVYIYFLRKITAFILLLFLTCVQVYFGVFGAPVWNVLAFFAIAFFLVNSSKGEQRRRFTAHHNPNIRIFAVTVAVTALAAFIVFPGESLFLSELSETIRDQFGETIERHIVSDIPPTEATAPHTQPTYLPMDAQDGGQDNHSPGGQEFTLDRDEVFAGSQIGAAVGQRLWILWIIGAGFIVWGAVWFARKVANAYAKRKIFNSADNAEAIQAMFNHLVAWLVEFGAPTNTAFADYADQLPSVVAPEKYLSVVELWQKAVFSNHQITVEDKTEMRGFLDSTKNQLASTLNPFSRARTTFRLFIS